MTPRISKPSELAAASTSLITRWRWAGSLTMPPLHSFAHLNARIVAPLPIELIMSDVDRNDSARAVLKQTIGESTRRRAHIKTHKSADVDFEMAQSCFQLDATATDVARRRFFFDSDLRLGRKNFR